MDLLNESKFAVFKYTRNFLCLKIVDLPAPISKQLFSQIFMVYLYNLFTQIIP